MNAPERYWNHRVVRHKQDDANEPYYWAVHEAHYEGGECVAIAVEPLRMMTGDGVTGVRWMLQRMRRAVMKPVLDAETLKELES